MAADLRALGFFPGDSPSLFCVKAPQGSEAVIADAFDDS